MKPFRLNLNLTDVLILVAVGVLVPVLLSTAVGIVALVLARDVGGVVTGVLVLCFAVAAAGSAVLTVVLTGRKIRLARRQADFVAGVSHELRTPLSAIRLYAQTLQSGQVAGDPQETAKCLATILRETEWLDFMIDGVLTWRASSSGKMALNRVSRPVTRAVQEAVQRFRGMAGSDEMELSLCVESRRNVRHDARAVNAVVLNLLSNAYKYTGSEKRIEVRVRDEDGGVAITVRDNGIGMTPGEAKRVFQPFYRVGRKERGGSGGVGLGLAIARHLVERHGGTIGLESQPGDGSTFTIRLPTDSGGS